jgi:hypothetical protein
MKNKTKRLGRIFYYPFFLPLLGIFSVLFLASNNLGQSSLSSIWPSLAIALFISVLISAICLVLIHPASRAYLAAFFLMISFFIYGHILNILKGKAIVGIEFGKNSSFLPIFLTLVIVGLVYILRNHAIKAFPTPVINYILLGLCAFQILKIANYQISTSRNELASSPLNRSEQIDSQTTNIAISTPDIYYIIIDGLVSEDVMKNEFKYSDYDFPDQLRERGFIIPACAFSNYDGTSRSLASSLNMDYLHDLGVDDSEVNTNENDPVVLFTLLHKNKVLDFLKSQGYKFVSFRGFFPLNDFKEADKYYNYFENQAGYDELEERNFRSLFLQTTFLNVIKAIIENHSDNFTFLPEFVFNLIAPDARELYSRSYQWYQQHMYQFDKLQEIPSIPGKKFIYSHFYTTHQPYVLKPDGQLLWPINEDNSGYVSAVKYTSKRILEVIDSILENSEIPPVIIIQGDHGKDGTDKLDNYRIMNAYYLPNSQKEVIYPTITPVNSFRVIFNQYFSKNLPILPDVINKTVGGQIDFQKIPVDCELN